MVTLKDIARACGVSVATVSRALNGQADVNPETAERVRAIVREMGYYPNAAARALKTNRSFNVGIVYEDKMDHEYFSLVIDALRGAAERRGYDLTFLSRSLGKEPMGYYEHAKYRSCDGVIVVQADFLALEVVRLVASDLPTVVIDHEYENCDCVLSDNGISQCQIVRYAYERGHRRIAFVHGEDCAVTRRRTEGFYRGCAELGLRVPPEYVQAARYHNPQSSGQAARTLLTLPEPPTCVLFQDDYSCLGAMTEIEKRGFALPGDIAIVGYDGIHLATVLRPKLTTYRQNVEDIGVQAVRLMADAIENPASHSAQRVTVTGHMQLGDTL